MASNQIVTQYDDSGYPVSSNKTVSVAYTAAPFVVKQAPGRLATVTVTTLTAGGTFTFYDNATGAASGTPLLVVPIAAAAGTVYALGLPAAAGISVVAPSASAGVLTVAYS